MFKKELKDNFKIFIIWSVLVALFIIIVFTIYPSLSSNFEQLDLMINTVPKEILEIFNMDIVSFKNVSGWFLSEGYIFIALFGSCFAAILGGTILAKEEDDHTIEFLYSKPISKNKILASKIGAGLFYITFFNLIISLTIFIGLLLNNDFNLITWALTSVGPLITQFIFFFITLLISIVIKKGKRITGISISTVLGTYLLQVLSTLSDKISFFKYLSPFEYTNSRGIILNNSFEIIYMVLCVFIIISCFAICFYLYNKKEFI